MPKDNSVVEDIIKDAETKLRSLDEYEVCYCTEHPELSRACGEAFRIIEEKRARWRKVLQK